MKKCGMGLLGFIGLVFLILLVCKIGIFPNAATEWSWLWVTCPLWCIPAIFVSVTLLFVAIMVIFAIVFGVCYLVYLLVRLCVRGIKNIIKNRKERAR